MLPLLYAQEHNLFDKYGVEVEVHEFEGGSDAVRTMVAGQTEVTVGAAPAVVSANLAGEPIEIIAGIINNQLYSLVVDPSLTGTEALIGKSMAVSDPGTGSDTILREGLLQLGLTPDEDVTIVSVGGNAARLAALEGGSVSGTVVSAPFSGMAKALGYRVLLGPGDYDRPYQHTIISASPQTIADKRPALLAFLRAISEATYQMQQDEESTKALGAKLLLLDLEEDAAQLQEGYDVVVRDNMDPHLTINKSGVQRLIDDGRADNAQAIDLTTEDVIDLSLLQELEESGFFDSLAE